jgi:hypothetical protein
MCILGIMQDYQILHLVTYPPRTQSDRLVCLEDIKVKSARKRQIKIIYLDYSLHIQDQRRSPSPADPNS